MAKRERDINSAFNRMDWVEKHVIDKSIEDADRQKREAARKKQERVAADDYIKLPGRIPGEQLERLRRTREVDKRDPRYEQPRTLSDSKREIEEGKDQVA